LPSSEICCGGDPGEQPVPGVDTLFLYDVAYQWHEMTGRPCVLALWVARREAATPEVVADFLASRDYGMARIVEIAEDAAQQLGLPALALERYLRENIDFSLDAENRAGLELYFERCAEAGLIPRARPLELVAAPGDASVALHDRSEEHTSELQSPCKLVCRLLLEKKKISDVLLTDLLDGVEPITQ